MRSLGFQTNFVLFALLLLVVVAQAAVDVLILHKKDYPDNPFTLEHLESHENIYLKVKGKPFVAVQATLEIDETSAKIHWPNNVPASQQDSAPVKVAPASANPFKLLGITKLNLNNNGPDYNDAFFVLATNPDIDGRRSFIILPTNIIVSQGAVIEITFTLESLQREDQNMLNEINTLGISETTSENAEPLPQPGDVIARGLYGEIRSVSYNDVRTLNVVMKTCKANKPGTVVSLEQWEKIDFTEKINRNDYRIGRLLKPHNVETSKIGPIYYTQGTIAFQECYYYYFTMEKIKGVSLTLDDVLQLNGDYPKLAQIFLGMLNAVIRLHKAGVLHRDIHIGNFMKLDGSNEFVVIDYGLSRVAVEWENHINKNRPISTKEASTNQPLRTDYGLGTDFNDDLEMFVFLALYTFTNSNFFGNSDVKPILMGYKIKVLADNWLDWPHVAEKFQNGNDYLVKNLNDLLFLSPTLLHCRKVHNLNLTQDQLRDNLKGIELFRKNKDYNEVPTFGNLLKEALPVVEDRYTWPDYDKYKTALSNIEKSTGGQRHPSDNPNLPSPKDNLL